MVFQTLNISHFDQPHVIMSKYFLHTEICQIQHVHFWDCPACHTLKLPITITVKIALQNKPQCTWPMQSSAKSWWMQCLLVKALNLVAKTKLHDTNQQKLHLRFGLKQNRLSRLGTQFWAFSSEVRSLQIQTDLTSGQNQETKKHRLNSIRY